MAKGYRLHIEATESTPEYYETMEALRIGQQELVDADHTIEDIERLSYIVTEDEYIAECQMRDEA
jgi:hypothetical protein